MKKNMGRLDRVIRTLLAITIVFLYEKDFFEEIVGRIMLVIAAMMIVTSFFAYCPLYTLLGFNSSSKRESKS